MNARAPRCRQVQHTRTPCAKNDFTLLACALSSFFFALVCVPFTTCYIRKKEENANKKKTKRYKFYVLPCLIVFTTRWMSAGRWGGRRNAEVKQSCARVPVRSHFNINIMKMSYKTDSLIQIITAHMQMYIIQNAAHGWRGTRVV